MPPLNVVRTKRKRKDHQRMVGIRKAQNNILTLSSKHGSGELMLSCMFPCPSLLSPPMIPFTGSLLRLSHHPQMSMCSFVFYWWTNSISKKEEKECSRVIGMGGTGKAQTKFNLHRWRNTDKFAFPPCSHSTALRPSHSSSSWLPKHNVSLLNILH